MKRNLIIVLLLSGSVGLQAQERVLSWEMDSVDGHRTGVVASTASNVTEAMGEVSGRVYYAPNGKKFRRGTVTKVARIMLEAQPAMAMVKTVIGYSTRPMTAGPDGALGDWYIDELMRAVSDSTGKKVDIGFANRGGVRIDMPGGPVLYDDIMSMFPFKNHICYVALRGRDVRALFEQMASTAPQIVGGAEIVIKDRELASVTVDGEPLDDDRLYGVATLDFLLDGGDNYKVARNAEQVIECESYLYDTMLAYVKGLTAAGKPVEFEPRHWITIQK